jgi:hypothetical protein
MISVVKHLVWGPYCPGQEKRLKKDVIAERERRDPALRHFMIESEDTVPGFPDVLCVKKDSCLLIEFKVSDDQGVLHFERTQPLFYKKHPDLYMLILAWDVPKQRLICIDPADVVAAKALRFGCPKCTLPKVVYDRMFTDQMPIVPEQEGKR